MTAAQKIKTTITIGGVKEKAKELQQSGKTETTVSCDLIPGFYVRLKKTASGTVSKNYVLRYLSPVTNKWDRYPIGVMNQNMAPGTAAEKAFNLNQQIDDGVDPKLQQATLKSERVAVANRQFKTLVEIVDGIWIPHLQTESKDAGRSSRTKLLAPAAFDILADQDVLTINEKTIHNWQDVKLAGGTKRKTLERHLKELKRVISHLVAIGYMKENSLEGVGLKAATQAENVEASRQALKREAEEQRKRRAMEPEEVKALDEGLTLFVQEQISNMAVHFYGGIHWIEVFIAFGKYHGMRPQDICALEWGENVNLETGALVFIPRKTEHHPDPIKVEHKIGKRLMVLLKNWKEQQRNKERFIFPSPKAQSGHLSSGSHNDIFARIVELAGIPEGELNFYCYRHNFISQMLLKNVQAKTVATLAGHKTTRMIDEHYFHLVKASTEGALEIVAESFEV